MLSNEGHCSGIVGFAGAGEGAVHESGLWALRDFRVYRGLQEADIRCLSEKDQLLKVHSYEPYNISQAVGYYRGTVLDIVVEHVPCDSCRVCVQA